MFIKKFVQRFKGEENNAKFEIIQGKDNQFYFRLVAPNNKIVAASEGYSTLFGCKKGIRAVRRYAKGAPMKLNLTKKILRDVINKASLK